MNANKKTIWAAALLALLAAFLLISFSACKDVPDVPDPPDTDAESTENYDGPPAKLTLVSTPVKTLYCEGEEFDPSGCAVSYDIEGNTGICEYLIPAGRMKAGQTSVTVSYKKGSAEIPVTVVKGQGGEFGSAASEKKYAAIIREYAEKNVQLENDWYKPYYAERKLENPAPDGVVKTLGEFVDYVDYHVFYHVDSIVVKPEFSFGNEDALLKELYYRSGLIASNASVKCHALEDGYLQIVLRYYDSTLLVSDLSGVTVSKYESGINIGHASAAERDYSLIDGENGVTVYNSEQLQYALERGIGVAPVKDSPAEKLLNRATEILNSCCSDGMSPFEKMYAVYSRLVSDTAYDLEGETWAGSTLDYEFESDMTGALLASFHAEGPLLYGNAVCYGYAKAYSILLSLEGLDVRRVTGHESGTYGRSAFVKLNDKYFDPAICTHSYLYVRIDGRDYLSDPTFCYAGNIEMGGKTVTWYRDFALAMTKEEHAQVYTDMVDTYSSSPEYNPGSYCYLSELKYDGEHPLLIEDAAGVDAYFTHLKKVLANEPSGNYYVNLTVNVKAGSAEQIKNRIRNFAASAGKDFRTGTTERSYNGGEYYGFLIALEK